MNPLRRSCVLIVEECASIRAVIRLAVESSGACSLILEAHNAYDALYILPATRVDLVLISAELRLLKAAELVTRIRERTGGQCTCVLLVDPGIDTPLDLATMAGVRATMILPLIPAEFRAKVGMMLWGDVM
jgi:DNA-binding response OmpR family regulator